MSAALLTIFAVLAEKLSKKFLLSSMETLIVKIFSEILFRKLVQAF
jgi:hypothetical protein